MSDPLAINSEAGVPAYDAREFRRAMATLLGPGIDPFGAQEGLRPGHTPASVSGTTVTVHDSCWVVYPGHSSAAGPYLVPILESQVEVDPPDASQTRIDLIVIRVYDHDEDMLGQRTAVPEYVPGEPSASPEPPAAPTGALPAFEITVPTSGALTVTRVAPHAVASGGVQPVEGEDGYPIHGLYDGRAIWDRDARKLLVRDQGDWTAVGVSTHEEVRGRATANSGSASLSGSESTIATVGLVIPSDWQAWDVDAHGMVEVRRLASAGSSRGFLPRLRHGTISGTLLTPEIEHVVGGAVAAAHSELVPVSGSLFGRSGTGTQTVRFTGQLGANDDYERRRYHVYARAVRTA